VVQDAMGVVGALSRLGIVGERVGDALERERERKKRRK
jgi:hypothetical protein